MLAITGYAWLKSFHVLMAVIWVGGDIIAQLLALRAQRTGDPLRLREIAGEFEWIGTRVFTPVSLILLVLGIWMVVITPAWTFGQLWIDAALAMFAFSFVSGAFYLGPTLGRAKRLAEENGFESPEVQKLVGSIFLVSRIELVLLILIVFDMVLKPGV